MKDRLIVCVLTILLSGAVFCLVASKQVSALDVASVYVGIQSGECITQSALDAEYSASNGYEITVEEFCSLGGAE